MCLRSVLAGALLVGLCLAWGPAPAQAAIWPFSMFTAKTPPVKRSKSKRGKPRPGAPPKSSYSR